MAAPHAFLDILANAQICDAYLAGRISIILTSDLETILWTNGAGAHFMGMRTVAETIGVESGFDRLTRHQIEAGLEVAKPVQVRGIGQNEAFLVNETNLPPLGKVVFLRSVRGLVDHEGSANLIEGLSDETTAAAVFDLAGHVIQASENFDLDWFDEAELKLILSQAYHERRTKKRLLQKNPAMPIGVLKLSHDPAVFLLIAAKDATSGAENATEVLDFSFDPALLPCHFGWRIDANGCFEEVSSELEQVVGREFSDLVGKSFAQLAQSWNMDHEGTLRTLFTSHNAWGGHKVHWPVEGSETRVAITFHALPVYSREREFVGFRGFSLIEAIRQDQPTKTAVSDMPSLHKGLSAQEHEAFSIIARILQADLQQQESLSALPAAKPDLATMLATFSPTGLHFELLHTSPFVAAGLWATLAPAKASPLQPDLSFLQKMPLNILVYRDEKILLASDHLLQVTGYPTLDSFRVHGVLSQILRDWLPKNILQGARGESLPIRAQMREIPWIDGQAASMICFLPDTQRTVEHLQRDLQNVQNKTIELSSLLNLVSDGVLIVDRRGMVHFLNDGAQRIFKHSPEAMCGRSFISFFAQNQHDILARAFAHLCQISQGKLSEEGLPADAIHAEAYDGENVRHIIKVRFFPMAVDDGYYLLLRDVSDVDDLARQIEPSHQQKPHHLPRMSHQIRTPLTAVIGLSQLILAEKYGPLNNDRYRAYLSDIVRAGEHIMLLLQHFDESGTSPPQNDIKLNIQELLLGEIFPEVLAQMAPKASERRIILRTSLGADLAVILADARACRQMMLGVLATAVHLTPAGGQIIVSMQNVAPRGVLFRVRDTGRGLRADELAALPQIEAELNPDLIWQDWGSDGRSDAMSVQPHAEYPFRQFSATTVLAATKKLTEANKSHFNLRSEAGKGTLVEIIFPFA